MDQIDQMDLEEPVVQILILTNGVVLISQIVEVISDLGQPDCKLIKPYVVETMTPWLNEYTNNNEIAISSDKILTLIDPKQSILNNYLEFIK